MDKILNQKILEFYIFWDKYEKEENSISIIDFNLFSIFEYNELVKDSKLEFISRKHVFNYLEQLLDQVSKTEKCEFHNKELIVQRLLGSHTYLRALLGEKISFSNYVEGTLGFTPWDISNSEIEAIEDKVFPAIKEMGFDSSKETIFNFLNKLTKKDLTTFPEDFRRIVGIALVHVKEKLEIETECDYSIEFCEVDEYWMNWIDKEVGKPLRLRVNTHKRNIFRLGSDINLGYHEIAGHAVQADVIQDQVSKNEIDRSCLITTVHSVETFSLEGVAQSVLGFINSNDMDNAKYLYYSSQQIGQSFLYSHRLLEKGADFESVIASASERFKTLTKERITKNLTDSINNPLLMGYNNVYYPSYLLFAQGLTLPIIKRMQFLKKMYKGFFTPRQIASELWDNGIKNDVVERFLQFDSVAV